MPSPAGDASANPLRCASCLYDLSGLADGKCPECGTPFGELDRIAHARLSNWTVRAPHIRRRFVTRAPIAVAVVFVVALIVEDFTAALGAAGAILVFHFTLIAAGATCSLSVRPWQRDAFLALWLRHSWWLQLPWLCAPIGAAFTWALGTAMGGFSPDAGLMVFLMLLQPWIAIVVVSLIGFLGMLDADAVKAGVRRRRVSVLCVLAALACLAFSVLLGLTGGAWLVGRVVNAMT